MTYDTISYLALASWVRTHVSDYSAKNSRSSQRRVSQLKFSPLKPIRNWLNKININNPEFAKLICKLIPSQCPFARTFKFNGKVIFSIPPLCKINPLYEELMTLRFRALCYLADQCGEDISSLC